MNSWLDIERDGRRLEAIIKLCYTKMRDSTEPSLIFAYMDRCIKATHEKIDIAKVVLKVDEAIKEKKIAVSH